MSNALNSKKILLIIAGYQYLNKIKSGRKEISCNYILTKTTNSIKIWILT